jgi:hypothetical protein
MRNTDDKGLATFPAVASGPCPVTVDLRGYQRFTGSVDVEARKSSPTLEVRLAKLLPIEERLASMRISFNFTGASPQEVVKFINDAKQLNIVIDPALARTLDNRTITLSVSDRPVDEALRALCDAIGATLKIQKGSEVVFITAAKR